MTVSCRLLGFKRCTRSIEMTPMQSSLRLEFTSLGPRDQKQKMNTMFAFCTMLGCDLIAALQAGLMRSPRGNHKFSGEAGSCASSDMLQLVYHQHSTCKLYWFYSELSYPSWFFCCLLVGKQNRLPMPLLQLHPVLRQFWSCGSRERAVPRLAGKR